MLGEDKMVNKILKTEIVFFTLRYDDIKKA